MRIGLLSDTHGLLRPQALEALRGSDHIVHAGDIGDPAILAALAVLAPLTAVRGNNDRDAWARGLPETARLACGGVALYVLHDRKQLAIDPVREGIGVVVAGHSHRPQVEERGGVLHVNPRQRRAAAFPPAGDRGRIAHRPRSRDRPHRHPAGRLSAGQRGSGGGSWWRTRRKRAKRGVPFAVVPS